MLIAKQAAGRAPTPEEFDTFQRRRGQGADMARRFHDYPAVRGFLHERVNREINERKQDNGIRHEGSNLRFSFQTPTTLASPTSDFQQQLASYLLNRLTRESEPEPRSFVLSVGDVSSAGCVGA